MKRKILSLILVLMLLPLASVFVACGKEKSYNLNNLKTDFNKIDEENDNIVFKDKQILFTYSENVKTAKETIKPYTELDDYNYVLNNLMSFSMNYIELCSNNKATKNSAIKNEINSALKDFSTSAKSVNASINSFDEIIDNSIIANQSVKSLTCLNRYQNLLSAYDELFRTASNLNNALAKLYFKHILNNSNPDVTAITIENFDASVVINKLNSKIDYQKCLLTESFVEMYIDGGKLAEKIINEEVIFDLTEYDYSENIEAINKVFVESTSIEIANNETNKQQFYDLAVQAHALQEILFNDLDKFITAVNKISYSTVIDSSTATSYEKLCADIIESNYKLIEDYNVVLSQMLTLMGV